MTSIHYEPHPVSPERKAELRAQGLVIVDAVYAPAEIVTGELTRDDIAKMNRKDVVDLLAAHGVEGATGKVGDLRKWLEKIIFMEA